MSEWDEWRDNMMYSFSGKMTLLNIDYDLRTNRISKSTFDQFQKLIVEMWRNARTLPHDQSKPEQIFNKVIDSNPSLFLFRGSICGKNNDDIIRIMDADDFVNRHLIQASGILSDRGYVTDQDMLTLQTYGFKKLLPSVEKNLQGRRPYVWVTDLDEFHNELAGIAVEERPEHVRNVLGLLHYTESPYLIGVVYPSGTDSHDALYAPTFFEGCPSRIYRSRKTPDGWGRTVNLVNYKDGLKEAIHPAMPFTAKFELEFIGRVEHPVFPSHDLFEKFVSSF